MQEEAAVVVDPRAAVGEGAEVILRGGEGGVGQPIEVVSRAEPPDVGEPVDGDSVSQHYLFGSNSHPFPNWRDESFANMSGIPLGNGLITRTAS